MHNPHTVRRPVENAYLVRQRDRRLLRELMTVLAVVLVLGSALLAYTWVHIEIVRTGYRIDRLQQDLHGLEERERRLGLDVALRSQPAQIEDRAARELGMRAPTLDQTLFFEELAR